jgi:peptidoglycan/LPS O-acetylase OafA/YrhL
MGEPGIAASRHRGPAQQLGVASLSRTAFCRWRDRFGAGWPLLGVEPIKQSDDEKRIPASFAQEYRPDIDGLRAIAVAAVIAYHLHINLVPGGLLGVDMFFVISGYVITVSLISQAHKSFRELLLDFYSRRIKRLLPALVLCVVVTCFIGALFISPQEVAFHRSMKAGFFALVGLSNIYFLHEATDYFGASAQLNLFTQTWSLGVEEQFYLVFPALLWTSVELSGHSTRGRKFLIVVLGLLTIISILSHVGLKETMPNGAFFLMPPRFWELSAGCMTALVTLNTSDRFSAIAPWPASALMTTALIFPAALPVNAAPTIVIGTAVLIMTLRPGHLIHRLLTLRWMLLVGLMSYSLYLWHWSILAISRWTVGVHWWLAPFQVGLILSLAAVSYFLVERPLRHAKWSTSQVLTIGLGMIVVLCSAGVIFVTLKSATRGMLYTGTPAQLAAKGIESLMNDKWYGEKLEWRATPCILSSNNDVGKQINFDECTLKMATRSEPHFVVIGNSYSAAEFEMYAALNEGGLGIVTATSSWGASPVPEIPNTTPWAKASDYYWSSVVPTLISHLGYGDVLIMINDLNGAAPASTTRETERNLVLLEGGLNRLANELRPKGVQIVFQSANPFMREAECTPDTAKVQWFSLHEQPSCTYYSKIYSIERMKSLNEVLQTVQARNPNFHVLDLFSVFCPEDICKFYNDRGVFLYRDGSSHPSIEANYLSRPIFLNVVNRATSASGIMRGAASER